MIISIPVNRYVERLLLCSYGDFGIGLPMFKYWIHVNDGLQHGGDGGGIFINLIIVVLITIVISLVHQRRKKNK